MPKTFANIIRIFFLIDMTVVFAMRATPFANGSLKASAAEKNQQELHPPVCLITAMRKKPMIAGGNAKPGQKHHCSKQQECCPMRSAVVSHQPDCPCDCGNWGEYDKRKIDPFDLSGQCVDFLTQ